MWRLKSSWTYVVLLLTWIFSVISGRSCSSKYSNLCWLVVLTPGSFKVIYPIKPKENIGKEESQYQLIQKTNLSYLGSTKSNINIIGANFLFLALRIKYALNSIPRNLKKLNFFWLSHFGKTTASAFSLQVWKLQIFMRVSECWTISQVSHCNYILPHITIFKALRISLCPFVRRKICSVRTDVTYETITIQLDCWNHFWFYIDTS